MLYIIKTRLGPISNLAKKDHRRTTKYQIIINGVIIEHKNRTRWSGLGTTKRILRNLLHDSLISSYGWEWFRCHYEVRDDIVTEMIKQHAGTDPSCRIYLRKVNDNS